MTSEERELLEEVVRWLRFGPQWVQQEKTVKTEAGPKQVLVGGDPRERCGTMFIAARLIEEKWLGTRTW